MTPTEAAVVHFLSHQWPTVDENANVGQTLGQMVHDAGVHTLSTGEEGIIALALGIWNGGTFGDMTFGQAWQAIDKANKHRFVEALQIQLAGL